MGNQAQFNENAPWLQILQKDYPPETQKKECEITDEIFDKAVSKMANDKPGRDLTTCVWIKNLKSIRQHLKGRLRDVLTKQTEMPEWLITTKTVLVAKNKETKNEQNYRPIALQNCIYNIYTGILAEFTMDHCKSNNIIIEEQAAWKTGSWACTDQLLVNKMIYEEATRRRRNFITIWLDYKKAFHSVPHLWVIKSLQLAKIPTIIIDAKQSLMDKWRTKVHLCGESTSFETRVIDYYGGILQGDLLSLKLFVLAVNPLSH